MERFSPKKGRGYSPSRKKSQGFSIPPIKEEKPLQPRRNLVSYGPSVLGISQGAVQSGSGPGEPPEGFVGGTTSRTEWYVWWALDKILKPAGIEFSYQSSFQGGRHVPGGSVVDFVIYMPLYEILLRVQTYRFHFALGSDKQSYDMEQKIELSDNEGVIVVDIYEQDFIDDETGGKVLQVCNEAINGVERSNPLATGMVFDV